MDRRHQPEEFACQKARIWGQGTVERISILHQLAERLA
jgi:hypothetical protein